MKKLSWLLFAVVLVSCNSAVKKEDLAKLNGYWEIQKVDLPNGSQKDYKVNSAIDYFEVKNDKGFRQKVMPQFDGRFETNDIKENFKIVTSNNTFFIEYTTNSGKWKEEIVAIKDSSLVLKNKENLKYTYKKFKPFSLK